MDEIAELRRLIAEKDRQLAEEQRRREDAESRALNEQQRRQEAEAKSQSQTLQPYLESCHSLSLAINVVTDRSLTTQGHTTNPTGRISTADQNAIWDLLGSEPSFFAQPAFPSQTKLGYVRDVIKPISCEMGLRIFECNTVEDAVRQLVEVAYNNPLLRDGLGLRGIVSFESHLNLPDHPRSDDPPAPEPAAPAAPLKGKGKGNRADQFCVYRTSSDGHIPATAIEYKAPQKLSKDEVTTGLASEIQPDRDVSLAAAVVTQLFSDMIGKNIQYGYICTGQVFIFLHIPDDPTVVMYHVCVPNEDVPDDGEDRLGRTAVAQIFAFTLQALRSGPAPPSWRDTTSRLGIWAVDYEAILRTIPESVRKGKRNASPYKPGPWRNLDFKRSPIRTRSSCQPNTQLGAREEDDGDDGEDVPPSPTMGRSTRSGQRIAIASTSKSGRAQRERIQDRPYCTRQCLLGLAYRRPVDKTCPNASSHRHKHMSRAKFQRLLNAQLATDRGRDADCVPLYINGAIGALFKARLSAYGYTVVAKGVEPDNLARLQHENKVYDQLRAMQGHQIPVCLGLIDLILPQYYDTGTFFNLLLLSWAGRPVPWCIHQLDQQPTVDAMAAALADLHRHRILHCDAEPRNMLYDAATGSLTLADFERSKIRGGTRPTLGAISPNGQGRKRKLGALPPQKQEKEKDDDDEDRAFAREMRNAIASVSRWPMGDESERGAGGERGRDSPQPRGGGGGC
ncbi:hypothetical protein B0T22DRAFT_497680 [Podospora appendiculata]|uniref:Protein kinase domain-containing protein n=1 Tax=Podospora appendiculata TaxID=314037 RepID=A0AAE1CIJ1_9PEZI|nr:hypothetical protein B0T22DRAFT_497680 [Podospora appendiculata]